MFTGQSPARKKVVPDSPAKPHFSRPHFRSGSLNFGSTPPSGGGGSAGTPLSLGEAVGEDGGGVNNNGESPVRGLFSSWNAGHTMVDSPTESYNPVTQSRRVSSHYKYNNNPSTTTKSDRVAQEEEEAKQFAIREGLSGPRLWNDYHDIKSIGEGNFGVVFKATHDLDGQIYAIKKTTKPIISDADLQHRLQEVYALAELTGGAGLLRNGVASAASPSNNSNSCVDAASMGARYILRYYDSWVEELEGGGPAVTSLEFGEPPMRGTRGGIGNNHNGDDDGIGGGGDENALDQGCAVCIRMEYVNGGNIDKRAYTIRDPLREVCVGVVCSNRRTSISSDDRGFAASSTSTTASVPGEKRSTRSRSHDYGGEEAEGRASRSKSRRSEPSPLSASERAGGGGVETSDIDTNMTPTINHVRNHPTNHTSTRSRSPSPQVALVEEIRTDRLSATLPPPPSCTPPQRPITASSPTSPSATLQSHRSATTNSLLDGGGGEVTVPFLRLLPERVLELIFHMAAALQRIHQRYGMVHLDVKPDNIFCSLNDEDDAIPTTTTTTTPTTSSRAGQKSEDRQLNSPNSPLASTTTSASPSRQSIIFKLGDFGLARQINSVSATGEIFKGVNDDEGDRRYLCPYLLSGEQPLMLESADVFSLGRSVLDLIVSSSPEIAAAGMDKRFRSLIDVPLATGAGGSSSNEYEKMVAAEMSNSNSEMSTIQEQLLLEVLIGQCQPQAPLDVASSGCPLVPSDVAALVSATSPILTYHRPPNSSSQSQNNMTASPSSQSAGAPTATQFRSSMDVPNGVRIWSFNGKEAVDPSTPTMPSSQRQQFDQERTQVLAPLASLITSMVHPDPRQRPSTLYIMAAAFQILQSVQQQSSTTTSTCFAPICEEDLTNLADMEMRINTKVSAVAELEAQIEQMMATLQQEDGDGFEHSGEHYHV